MVYFKYRSTKQINLLRSEAGTRFLQRNYRACSVRSQWEHIICSNRELNMIREYILNTPLCWDADLDNSIKLNHAVPTLIDSTRREVGL